MGHRIAYRSILQQRLIALERADGKAPTRVLVMQDGNLGWLGFEEMELDAASAKEVIDHFNMVGNDLPIDYHHATKHQEEGRIAKAPAAGWITALEYVPGEGLYGEVKWTEQATKEIEAEEYKYLSPVVLSDEDDEIKRLHSMALTNRPRTKDQIELLKAAELLAATVTGDMTVTKPTKPKVVAAQDEPVEPAPLPAVDETQKLLSDLIMAMQQAGLTIADEAPLEEVLKMAIEAIKGAEVVEKEEVPVPVEEVAADAATAAAPVTAPCAEPTGATTPAALPCKAADSAEVCALRVKAERLGEVETQLKVLMDERKAGRTDALVEAEITRGVILPDNLKAIAAARNLANADEALFKATYAAMDPIVEPGRVVAPTASDKKESQKTERTKLIAASLEEFEKTGVAKTGAKKRYYVDAWLEHHDEPDLNESEVKELEKVGV